MKKKLAFAGLMAAALSVSAQYVTTSATPPSCTQVFKIGSGAGTLHFPFTSGGLLIQSSCGDRALMELQSPSSTGVGANRTVLQALAAATYFDIANASIPLYFMNSGSKISIGHANTPTQHIDLRTSNLNDGYAVTQLGTTAAAVHITNGNTGGNHFALFSTGSTNSQGAGNFSIFQYGTAAGQLSDRIFVKGSDGNVGIGTISPQARLHVYETTANATAAQWIENTISNPGGMNRGLHVDADNGNYNWAGVFSAGGSGSPIQNIGVYAATPMPYSTNDWAGYFEGHAKVTQDLTVGNNLFVNGSSFFNGPGFFMGTPIWSDRKLKKDIKNIENPMDVLMALNPKSYNFDKTNANGLNMPDTRQYGLIAQELQEVLPELVTEATKPEVKDVKTLQVISPESKFLTVNYVALIPFLIKGIQEQQKQIEAQQAQIDELLKAKDNSVAPTGINELDPTQSGLKMGQNEPNPFTGETKINYSIPEDIGEATLTVYDLSGKQLKKFPLTEKGTSSITLTSENLSAGMYIYSIVADGKLVDSKRMIVAEK